MAIDVDFGSHQKSVDVALTPATTVVIKGTVVGPATAVGNLPVRLVLIGNESLGSGTETALTNTDGEGRFTFANVPPGDYAVLAGRALNAFKTDFGGTQPHVGPAGTDTFSNNYSGLSIASEPGLGVETLQKTGDDVSGRATITVGREAINGLVVQTIGGSTLSGRVLFDGGDVPSDGHVLGIFGPAIGIEPADGDLTRTLRSSYRRHPVAEGPPRDPTFEIKNVIPGRYWVFDTGDGDYHLVGATWNGRDLLAAPLEITGDDPVTNIIVRLSSKHNAVSGVVLDAGGKPSAGAVLIFPSDRQRWREPGITAPQFRRRDVPLTGAYSATDLIPGDYFIAAVPLELGNRLLDAEFLATLALQATHVMISESGTQKIDLHLIGPRR